MLKFTKSDRSRSVWSWSSWTKRAGLRDIKVNKVKILCWGLTADSGHLYLGDNAWRREKRAREGENLFLIQFSSFDSETEKVRHLEWCYEPHCRRYFHGVKLIKTRLVVFETDINVAVMPPKLIPRFKLFYFNLHYTNLTWKKKKNDEHDNWQAKLLILVIISGSTFKSDIV